MSDAIDGMYLTALEAGVDPERFWGLSFGEVVDCVKSYSERRERDFKNSVRLRFLQAEVMARHLTLEKRDPAPQPWDYYPDLFKEEEAVYRKATKEEELERFKERRRQYAQTMNRMRRGL